MNEMSTLINFLIERFQLDSLVHTVTMQSKHEIDTQKENIYGLVNIDFKEAEPLPDVVVGYFDISIFQQRNTTTKPTDSKLQFDTNMIDNLNETFAIGNKFIQYFEHQNNEHNIEIVSKSRFRVVKNRPANDLDGYEFSIAFSAPNKTNGC